MICILCMLYEKSVVLNGVFLGWYKCYEVESLYECIEVNGVIGN